MPKFIEMLHKFDKIWPNPLRSDNIMIISGIFQYFCLYPFPNLSRNDVSRKPGRAQGETVNGILNKRMERKSVIMHFKG